MLSKIIAAVFLMGTAALAAPADYQERLASGLPDMKQVKLDMEDGMLVGFYEGPPGRVALTIQPSPIQPAGETGFDPAVTSGKKLGAQRVLLAALLENLETGSAALGDEYDTSMPKFEPVDVRYSDNVTFDAYCASVLRKGSAEGALWLLDRICTSEKGSDVFVIRMTAPTKEPQIGAQNNAQLEFVGMALAKLTQDD